MRLSTTIFLDASKSFLHMSLRLSSCSPQLKYQPFGLCQTWEIGEPSVVLSSYMSDIYACLSLPLVPRTIRTVARLHGCTVARMRGCPNSDVVKQYMWDT
jgi:hypothetical protein